jgi:hypothetical protein
MDFVTLHTIFGVVTYESVEVQVFGKFVDRFVIINGAYLKLTKNSQKNHNM